MLIAKSNNTATVNYLQYDQIFTLSNIIYAYDKAKKGKANNKRVFKYSFNSYKKLNALYISLKNRTYTVNSPYEFELFCISGQKIRLISTPDFKDLIIQHLLYNVFYTIFDKTFIYDSYGCRKNKGTHKASARCTEFLKKSPKNSYYLQLDISKYYYSIDHEILKESLSRVVKDPEILNIFMKFVNRKTKVGLNVGSMISQLYGLVYLNRLDHYIKRILKVKRYIRYVDDMVIIGESKERCIYLKNKIERYITKYLKLKFSKWQCRPITHGVNFVGYRTWRNKKLIRKRSLRTFAKAVKQNNERSIISILGHAKHSDTYEYFINILKETNKCQKYSNTLQKLLQDHTEQ